MKRAHFPYQAITLGMPLNVTFLSMDKLNISNQIVSLFSQLAFFLLFHTCHLSKSVGLCLSLGICWSETLPDDV